MTRRELDIPRFVHVQQHRAALRVTVTLFSLAPLAFWLAVAIGMSYLDVAGFAWVGWLLVTVWGVLSAPVLLVHLSLLLAVVVYGLTQQLLLQPLPDVLEQAAVQRAAEERLPADARAVTRVVGRVLHVLQYTSPLMGVSLWALVVLARIPAWRKGTAADAAVNTALQPPAPEIRAARQHAEQIVEMYGERAVHRFAGALAGAT
jgi:hypothetical protein